MFSIPGKQAVSITDRAAAHISKLMEKEGHSGLRIGVKKGGCAGMEYTMEYVDAPEPNDTWYKINNPNVEDACGSGESINIKDIETLNAERSA